MGACDRPAFCGSAQSPIGSPVRIVGWRWDTPFHSSLPSSIQSKCSSGLEKKERVHQDAKTVLERKQESYKLGV